jgi:hypothetical protein
MATDVGLFKLINNAVLDLQSADLQSYPEPLKRLGRLLRNENLEQQNRELLKEVNLDVFLSESEATQRGMIGSATLAWPEDDEIILGLKLALILKFADDPDYIQTFGYRYFCSSSRKIMAGVNGVVNQIIIPFVRDYRDYVENFGNPDQRVILPMSRNIFVVHGHDGQAREAVARFLERIGLTPIILNEQANRGRTVIEKIEANSDVSFAVVLLTPDDEGRVKGETNFEPRARQNVLLELGYFMARLGRDRVCALKKGSVSIPSDFAGVVWEVMDESDGWKLKLARELKAAGHQIDFQKLIE